MFASLPAEIQALVDAALDEMNSNPQHRLTPQRRRQIYQAFQASTQADGRRVCGWLAVITARRALPAFQEEFPEDGLPQDLLDAAIGVLQGEVDDATADDLQARGIMLPGMRGGMTRPRSPRMPIWRDVRPIWR